MARVIGIYFDTADSTYKAGLTPGWNPTYKQRLLDCLNAFDPLFKAAKTRSEFEFLVALFRVRGLSGPGWDAWENTVEVMEHMQALHHKADYEAAAHLWLWLYGHAIEASEPYETLASMLTITGGGRWSIKNLPDRTRKDGSTVPLSPGEKIQKLTDLATRVGLTATMSPLKGLVDRNLRNAIFHSDYSVYDGNVRIYNPTREYPRAAILDQVNHAIAYFEAIKYLIKAARAEYQEPKVIDVHPGFSGDPDERAVVMVRQGDGAVGLKDNWTAEEIRRGKITFRIGRFYGYEQRMLNADPFTAVFPPSRFHRANRILKLLPRFARARLVPLLRKTDWF